MVVVSPQFDSSAPSFSGLAPPLPHNIARTYRVREVCALLGIPPPTHGPAVRLNDETTFQCVKAKRGESIYLMHESFHAIYIVRLGQIKTVMRGVCGDERVLGFSMKGDLLGFDGICSRKYPTETIALTDTELVSLPYPDVLALSHRDGHFEEVLYQAASREMNRQRAIESLQNTLKAEARVAWFIEYQASRFAAQGYSSRQFLLPMTRRDIGSYLSVSLETVSRSLSTLAAAEIIKVDRRKIYILHPEALHAFRPIRASTSEEVDARQRFGSCWEWPTVPKNHDASKWQLKEVEHAQGVLRLDTTNPTHR